VGILVDVLRKKWVYRPSFSLLNVTSHDLMTTNKLIRELSTLIPRVFLRDILRTPTQEFNSRVIELGYKYPIPTNLYKNDQDGFDLVHPYED